MSWRIGVVVDETSIVRRRSEDGKTLLILEVMRRGLLLLRCEANSHGWVCGLGIGRSERGKKNLLSLDIDFMSDKVSE